MLKNGKMPTPWRHPKHGTYYLKKRVPLDIKHLWAKPDPYQVSLGTKDRAEANKRICKEWLKLVEEFDKLRLKAAQQLGLCEEIIPDLLEEWLHQMLKEDEQLRFSGRIDRAPGEPNPGFEIAVEQLDAGIASGDHPDFLIREAVWFLNQKGISYSPSGYIYAKFLHELAHKFILYFRLLAQRDIGKHVRTPEAPKAKDLMSIEALYDKFKQHRIANEKWKDPETQDKREYGPIVREFISVVGSKPVHQLTHQDAVDYFDHTVARADISLGTKKRNLSRIKTFLQFGREQYQVPDITGPLKITAEYKKTHNSYVRFSKDDLEALFHSEAYKTNSFKKASQYWIPMIGLYTGARIDEPASLLVSEIRQLEGVWCYFMSSKEANGGGKNDYAPRWVPIHPKLIEAGLLEYWKTIKGEGHSRLFPEMGSAERDGCGKRATVDFTEYRRSVGVGSLTGRSTKAFHSFRSTLISELKERGVDGETRRPLVGHASEKRDVHDEIYDQADFQPKKALAAISQANFGLSHPRFVDTESMKKARRRYLKKPD